MWLPMNVPIFFGLRLRNSLRLSSTSCMPTAIWVGRRLSIATGLRVGSRAYDIGRSSWSTGFRTRHLWPSRRHSICGLKRLRHGGGAGIAVATPTPEAWEPTMVIIICVAGAVAGMIIALVGARLVLPMVLRSQEARWPDGRIDLAGLPLPAALSDVRRVQRLTIAVYRYVMPLVFAAAGAMAAYYLFAGGAE